MLTMCHSLLTRWNSLPLGAHSSVRETGNPTSRNYPEYWLPLLHFQQFIANSHPFCFQNVSQIHLLLSLCFYFPTLIAATNYLLYWITAVLSYMASQHSCFLLLIFSSVCCQRCLKNVDLTIFLKFSENSPLILGYRTKS